jgi:heme/copper-type cytochrome/quinol oxidase subunit 1
MIKGVTGGLTGIIVLHGVSVDIIVAQNYWVFGLFPSTGILETRKHDVSETGSVSFLRR